MDFGYFPNNKKRRIIAKPNKKETVKEVLKWKKKYIWTRR